MKVSIRSCCEEDTVRLGGALGRELGPGDVLMLDGELGTGKTVLVRAMARERGHRGPVTSPTFTLIRTYPDVMLCHVDAYRLSGPGELVDAGIEEYLEGEWTCAVEWARAVEHALPRESLRLTLEFGEGYEERLITVEGKGRFERVVRALEEAAQR